MASDAAMDSTELKTKELLKEVQIDYSPSFTNLLNDVVSAIKQSIDTIPQDLQVSSLSLFPFQISRFCYYNY